MSQSALAAQLQRPLAPIICPRGHAALGRLGSQRTQAPEVLLKT